MGGSARRSSPKEVRALRTQAFQYNLKALRKHNGMSQNAFGEQIGASKQVISKWEHGQTTPTVDTVLLICYKFQISADVLLGVPKDWRRIK